MFNPLLRHHTALEKQLERTGGEPVEALPIPVRELHNPATCPTNLLPWLAWERSVDYWRDDWSEQTKRDVIAASVAVHRKKGTLAAVRQAIAAVGLQAVVDVPRDTPRYVPHTFRVKLDAETNPPTDSNAREIRYQIDHIKPARCSYSLTFTQQATTSRLAVDMALHSRGAESADPNYLNHREPARINVSRVAIAHTHLREAA